MSRSWHTDCHSTSATRTTLPATNRLGCNFADRCVFACFWMSRHRGRLIRECSGEIMIWLPETFSGVIQGNTGRGELMVLPGLARTVRVLKSTNKEVMLLMGSQQISGSEDSAMTDLCQLSSRSGKVIIGLSGQDRLPEQSGFWKKLSKFFTG